MPVPKHKVKWSFYLSCPLWNGSVPRIFELERIWEIVKFNRRKLSLRGVGLTHSCFQSGQLEDRIHIQIPSICWLLILYFPPVLYSALLTALHFVFNCSFSPHCTTRVLFFHPCPSIVTHLYICCISKL